jgi:hypothetical protein
VKKGKLFMASAGLGLLGGVAPITFINNNEIQINDKNIIKNFVNKSFIPHIIPTKIIIPLDNLIKALHSDLLPKETRNKLNEILFNATKKDYAKGYFSVKKF